MKIIVKKIDATQDEYILLHVQEVDERINKMIGFIENMEVHLIGKKEEKLYKVQYEDIYYIESVDKKSYMYTSEHVLALSEKLYQLEEKLSLAGFIRISKAMILNINKIIAIYPTVSGRFEAKLFNDEVVAISRSYVPALKKKLGAGRDVK